MSKRGKMYPLLTLVVALLLFGTAWAGGKSVLDLAVGDELYVCNCGADCPCLTMAKHEGNCVCGAPMVKAEVVALGDGSADMLAAGWDGPRTFKTTGKYACACGEGCPCDAISQKPGNCPCGAEMKKIE